METPQQYEFIPAYNKFEDLYEFLLQQSPEFIDTLVTNIDTTDGSKPTVHDLIFLIGQIEKGVYPLEALTREHGLRETVHNIIHKRETWALDRSESLLTNLHNEFDKREDVGTDDYKAEEKTIWQHQQRIKESREKLEALSRDSTEPGIITTTDKIPIAQTNFVVEQTSLKEERKTGLYRMFNKVKSLFRRK